MKHNRMISPLNNSPDEGKPDAPLFTKGSSEVAEKISKELIKAFANALDREELSPFEVMQNLVEFLVPTVMTMEELESIPANFRKFLMRNIELNFDYKDAKRQGIDLSDLLMMGVEDDMGGEYEE